jgi:co-chaperonin GroES (HSP10)
MKRIIKKAAVNHLVVTPLDLDHRTDSGLVVATPALDPQKMTERQRSIYGTVRSIGLGRMFESMGGRRADPPCEVGDIVAFSSITGHRVELDLTKYVILSFEDVLCVIGEADEASPKKIGKVRSK